LLFVLTVLDVLGSVLALEDGFVSLACWTACLSFLLIPFCGMITTSFGKAKISFPAQ
jgi:hypothetical protein